MVWIAIRADIDGIKRTVYGAIGKAVSITALTLAAAPSAFGAPCSVEGIWRDSFQGSRTVPAGLVGTSTFAQCPGVYTLRVSVGPNRTFYAVNTLAGGNNCDFTESMTLDATCNQAEGFYQLGGGFGPITWTRINSLQMTRLGFNRASALGVPGGGMFAYTTPIESGVNVARGAFVAGTGPANNPSQIEFRTPAAPGAPAPGGRIRIDAKYTVNGVNTFNDQNRVVTFGMSCYMVALEADYGTPPGACRETTISGVRHVGSETGLPGLPGRYCRSFTANIRLQGTGRLTAGGFVNYDVNTKTYRRVNKPTGADGTEVVAGRSVARDRKIIPGLGVLVDVDGIGRGLLANDTGGKILGYRLDLFRGAGNAACAGFPNPIRIGACQVAQGITCPVEAFR